MGLLKQVHDPDPSLEIFAAMPGYRQKRHQQLVRIWPSRLPLTTLLMTLLCTLSSACGWQLKGTTALSPMFERVYLDANQTPQIARLVQQQLSFRGSQLVEQVVEASVQLTVLELQQSQRTLSLTAGGQIKDIEIRSNLNVRLQIPNTNTNQVISVSSRRILENDDNQLVATQRDIEITRRDMQRELASQLMRRLEGYKASINPVEQ